jgi:glycosyltransferase involved in cell wall biosynthesis
MRIAMFTETFLPSTDGIVTRLCATLKYLAEQGHEVLLFAPEGCPETYASATVIGIPSFRFFLYPEKHFSFPRRKIAKHLRAFQPDLVHVVNPAFLGLGGLYYAWRFGYPLIASYHTNVPAYARHYRLNWLEPALWWYFRTLHNRATINLCTSRAMLKELDVHRFRNVGLWERGVDVERYAGATASAEMRQRLAPDAPVDAKILLYVGRLAAEKGLQHLRGALDALPNVHLAIVGDGPYRPELERTFAGSQIVFMGYLHGDDLSTAYASADGFVFPSTTETLGLVLFEAMASGLPIMAADSPPTREALENGEAGIIFDSTDARSIVESMETLLYDESRRRMCAEGACRIVKDLDWKGPTQQLLGHYQRLLSEQVAIRSQVFRGSRS